MVFFLFLQSEKRVLGVFSPCSSPSDVLFFYLFVPILRFPLLLLASLLLLHYHLPSSSSSSSTSSSSPSSSSSSSSSSFVFLLSSSSSFSLPLFLPMLDGQIEKPHRSVRMHRPELQVARHERDVRLASLACDGLGVAIAAHTSHVRAAEERVGAAALGIHELTDDARAAW